MTLLWIVLICVVVFTVFSQALSDGGQRFVALRRSRAAEPVEIAEAPRIAPIVADEFDRLLSATDEQESDEEAETVIKPDSISVPRRFEPRQPLSAMAPLEPIPPIER
jgi:hypothetical protein